jgi:hypothetical protein
MTTEKRGRGRPTKLTAELRDTILDAIKLGNYASVAAQFAGIDKRTFFTWMKNGLEGKAPVYVQFRKAVKEAEALAEARAIQIIAEAAMDNWQAAAWYLSRKHGRRWGDKSKHEITGDKGGPVAVQAVGVRIFLPPEESDEPSPEKR